MTKQIPLTQGKVALVDDADFDNLKRMCWCAHLERGRWYAWHTPRFPITGRIKMHRLIMDAQPGQLVDHINKDGLDNRHCNLRVCSNSENLRNRGKTAKNTSGYKGVTFDKSSNKWHAQIKVNYKNINLGRFDTPESAARAYNDAAIKYHGEFARLNKI